MEIIWDSHHGEYICTNCGGVLRHVFTAESGYETTLTCNNSAEDKGKLQRMERCIDNALGDVRKSKRIATNIKHYCDLLDVNEQVYNRTCTIFDNFRELHDTRPMVKVILACIILVCRTYKLYIHVAFVERLTRQTKLEDTIRTVSKITNIRSRVVVTDGIPYFANYLQLPFTVEKQIPHYFKRATRHKSSLGAETRMGIALYNLTKKLDIDCKPETIASMLGVSTHSIKVNI
jgi:transcription initiation factor TFIIIB Brf1 subunit/transcription initiation factor TFIIB